MPTRIVGDKALRRKLSKLSNPRELAPTLGRLALDLKDEIAKYPSGNQHRPQPFKTAKSRRFFFWALRQGIIEVPYRRGQSPGSEDHGQSWTVKGLKGGLQQVIGNDTSYGPLLQHPNKQASYHKQTGWKDTDEVAKEQEKEILKGIQRKIDSILARG